MKKDQALAELLGIMCGDGCLSSSKSQVKYYIYCSGNSLKDDDYMERYVPNLFYKVFGKLVNSHKRKDENTIFIKFSDKEMFKRFQELEIPVGKKYSLLKIPDFVLKSKCRQLAFVRGLFDTDGCVILSKQHRTQAYYPRIEIKSKNYSFLNSVMLLLKNHGFTGSVSRNADNYRLEVAGFKNLTLWRSVIGSSNKRNLIQLHTASKTYLNAF
ncbi:LAGLIDADG-like domain protein [uncultured archaeon]|nr:LAGLIDADG-like domain protein [uncultured archaeon]